MGSRCLCNTKAKLAIKQNIYGACMNTKNSCYTYFKIVGNFNPDDISALLNLTPEKSWKIGDLRRNGTKYDFALWET